MSRRKGHANLLYLDLVAAPYFGLGHCDASLWRVAATPWLRASRCRSAAAPELAEGSIQGILCRRAGAQLEFAEVIPANTR